ncbi:hypothetical protein F511_10857 [Dorcoceras hygrometricum]|uniref:Uncharacterized protein n=1 Tax=Dorcoceras hygrometricum TaxID=472368 RepID=A0A2Z7AH85_9LAMI|nr:hypothetical protein F511_10857 [Dorcoceras hygrometricum]
MEESRAAAGVDRLGRLLILGFYAELERIGFQLDQHEHELIECSTLLVGEQASWCLLETYTSLEHRWSLSGQLGTGVQRLETSIRGRRFCSSLEPRGGRSKEITEKSRELRVMIFRLCRAWVQSITSLVVCRDMWALSSWPSGAGGMRTYISCVGCTRSPVMLGLGLCNLWNPARPVLELQ